MKKGILNCLELKNLRRDLRNNATEIEALLWGKLRKKELGEKFIRQYSVGKYILDFYCPHRKLAIEIDGSGHDEEKQIRHDEARTAFLEQYGIRVLRFWNNEIVRDVDNVCDEILHHLQENTPLPREIVPLRGISQGKPPLRTRGGKILVFIFCSFFLLSCQSVGQEKKTAYYNVTHYNVIFLNGQSFDAELAQTAKERARGLMFREKLEPGHGMFFIFEKEEPYGFWMKNTLIPLDVIWISESRKVVDVQTLPPCKSNPCPVFKPKNAAKYVLEVNAGEFQGGNGDEIR